MNDLWLQAPQNIFIGLLTALAPYAKRQATAMRGAKPSQHSTKGTDVAEIHQLFGVSAPKDYADPYQLIGKNDNAPPVPQLSLGKALLIAAAFVVVVYSLLVAALVLL